MTSRGPWVEVPSRVVGPSLTAAGLAAWVLWKSGREDEAAATRELQDELDAALRSGAVGPVRLPRATVERAESLWESAAELLEAWSDSAGGDRDAGREASRLRTRIASLRRALDAG